MRWLTLALVMAGSVKDALSQPRPHAPIVIANVSVLPMDRERVIAGLTVVIELVTQGPYRWVRHPFYDAMALLIAGIALIAANWFVLVTGAVVFFLLGVRAQTEEAHLLARFGDAYRTYCESTGRFLPKLRRTIGTSRVGHNGWRT
jgi:Phospholipid methyltransferase